MEPGAFACATPCALMQALCSWSTHSKQNAFCILYQAPGYAPLLAVSLSPNAVGIYTEEVRACPHLQARMLC